MALRNINEWLPELRTKVAGASDDLLLQELEATVREFSTTTGGFIVNVVAQDLIANKHTYYLDPQPEGKVFIIWGVWYDGHQLSIINAPPRTTRTPAETPSEVEILGRGVIKFHPTPTVTKDDIWAADVAVIPKDYTYVPDDWWLIFFDDILNGAMARLYAMPKRPWSNAALVQFYERRFRSGMAEARHTMRKKYAVTDLPWVYPKWL